MLGTREVCDLTSLCPAAMPVGETIAGSGVLCRITGKLVTTGADPSSLRAFCCCPLAAAQDVTAEGERVELGYQHCPVWRHNRTRELREKDDLPENVPQRVRDALEPQFITRAA